MSGNLPKAKRIGGANRTTVWILAGVAVVLVGALAYLLITSQLFSSEARTDADRDYQLLAAAAKKNPKDPAIQMTLAETEYRLGRKKEGLQRAALAVKLGGTQAGFRVRYATLLVMSNQLDEANKTLQEEIKLGGGEDAEPYFLLAQVLSSQGNNAEAMKMMKRGLELNPNAADMRVIYGQLLEKAKQKDEAILQYQIALKFLPGDKTATAALKRLGVIVDEPTGTVAPHGSIPASTTGGDAK